MQQLEREEPVILGELIVPCSTEEISNKKIIQVSWEEWNMLLKKLTAFGN